MVKLSEEEQRATKTTYLGDSVYIRFRPHMGDVELYLWNGCEEHSNIVLEHSVLDNLLDWLKDNGVIIPEGGPYG